MCIYIYIYAHTYTYIYIYICVPRASGGRELAQLRGDLLAGALHDLDDAVGLGLLASLAFATSMAFTVTLVASPTWRID